MITRCGPQSRLITALLQYFASGGAASHWRSFRHVYPGTVLVVVVGRRVVVVVRRVVVVVVRRVVVVVVVVVVAVG